MTIRFGPFLLALDTHQLTRNRGDVHLSPKAFELLSTLVLQRPNALSKAVLRQRLWPDTFVTQANLSNLMAEIRAALGDSAREPAYIRTVHRFGYAFCGAAAEVTESSRAAIERPVCWIEWRTKRYPLSAGEHIIGRDEDAAIRIDASTVSRRHARIVVGAEGAVLEDSGSKNGTFRGGDRVTSPIRLANGDAIRIGSQLVTFHVRRFDSTETSTR